MLSKISKCIQKVPATNQVSPHASNTHTLDYRLQLLPPPGASASRTTGPIILSKLKLRKVPSKLSLLSRHSFSRRTLADITDFRLAETQAFMQFSKAPTSANFGDLPRGEIPEPLKINRPFRK